jgi:hypothetical protein
VFIREGGQWKIDDITATHYNPYESIDFSYKF